MILTITVTSDDIKTGIPKDSCRCPIALAANVLPARANAFMEAFDTGAGVAPFTFTTSLQEG